MKENNEKSKKNNHLTTHFHAKSERQQTLTDNNATMPACTYSLCIFEQSTTAHY